MKKTLALVCLLTVAGCAEQLTPDARLASNTAGALGLPANSVVITDRRADLVGPVYYVARTPRGDYACSVIGGGVLAMGLLTPPQCNPVR